jgi:putative transposase
MNADRPMYRSRYMTPEQRKKALEHRQRYRLAWHGPPHYESEAGQYLITAACFEHKPVIGLRPARMAEFESALLKAAQSACRQIVAWIVLRNHYHLLVHTAAVKSLLRELGKLHGRTSHRWNGEENRRARQVWHRAAETAMKLERHYWATLNYALHNAVRHGYVERWQDWPYSNAAQYLAEVGRDEAERHWREYPILDYGNVWDPPEL